MLSDFLPAFGWAEYSTVIVCTLSFWRILTLYQPEHISCRYKNIAPIPDNGKVVQLSEGECFYRIDGSDNAGPLVILVHGFMGCHLDFDPLSALLVKQGRRVLRQDNYGRGWSSLPRDVSELSTVDLYASQISELLLLLEEKGQFDVIGYSMGAGIAAGFCQAFGNDRIRSLVLCAPAGMPSTGGKMMNTFIGFLKIVDLVMRIFPLGSTILEYGYESYVRNSLKSLQYDGKDEDLKKLYSWYSPLQEQRINNEKQLPYAISSTIKGFPFNGLASVFQGISKLPIQTISLWGDKDDVVPIEGLSEMRELFPSRDSYKDVVISGGSHMFPIEQPKRVVSTLICFWNKLS